jgi:multicomponent Na+:H+ antiporter subunit D
MLSSLLNVAYLLPIPLRAFFGNRPPDADRPGDIAEEQSRGTIQEAPLPCLIAIGLTALGCVLLFFFPGPLFDLLSQIPLK